MSEKLLVIGSVAYDCIETPDDSADFILGGSASYAALAASYFAPTSNSTPQSPRFSGAENTTKTSTRARRSTCA